MTEYPSYLREPPKETVAGAKTYEELYGLKIPLVRMLKSAHVHINGRWLDSYVVSFPEGRNQPVYVDAASYDEASKRASVLWRKLKRR